MGVRPTATLLGALAIGVVTATDPAGWSPFGPAKWLVVSTVGLAAIASGTAIGWTRTTRWERGLVGVLGAVVLVPTITGLDGRYRWLGTPERHFGAFTWLLLVGIYLAGRGLTSVAEWRTVIRALAIGSVVLGGWAVLELITGRLIDLDTVTRRITGPFGSAALTGAASLLYGGAAAGLAADRHEHRRWRAVGFVGALGCTVALLGTGARAGWVGAVVGLAAVMRRSWLVPAGATLAIALLAISPRLMSVLERSDGAGSRLDEWHVAVQVIARHPVLGVGPEGYRLVFHEGVTDRYEQRYGRAVLPDRAHSAPLDIAVTLGVPGALAWGTAVILVVARLRRLARGPALFAGVAGGVIAYLGQQLLLFPLAELDPLAWGMAGLAVAATTAAASTAATSPIRRRRAQAQLLTAPLAVAAIAAGVFGVRELVADRAARRAATAVLSGAPTNQAVVESAADAVRQRGDVLRYRLLLGRVHAELGTVAGIRMASLDVAQALHISPRDPIAREERARLLSELARRTGAPADLDTAVEAWRALADEDDHSSARHLGLALALADSDQAGAAIPELERAAALAPDDRETARLLAELQALVARGDG